MRPPDPIGFSLAFVTRMRSSSYLRSMPTVRTAIALSRLLVVRHLRKGNLSGDDFIECSALVIEPEDQETAVDVALSILSAPIRLPGKGRPPLSENSAIADILDEIKKAETMDKAGASATDSQDFEQLLTDPLISDLIEKAGGIDNAKARFENVEGLKKFGQEFIHEQMGGLDENSFSLAMGLGLGDRLATESRSDVERMAAKIVMGKMSVEDGLESLAPFDLKLKLLQLIAGSKVDIHDNLQLVADGAKNLEELSDASAMGHIQIDRNKLFDAIKESISDHDFSELFEQTENFSLGLASAAKGMLYDNYPDLTESDLSLHAHLCRQWKSALERAVENRSKQAEESNFDEGLSLIRDLFNVSKRQGDPVLSQHLLEGIKGAAKGALKTAESIDDLLELINLTDRMSVPLPPDIIREQGEKMGLSSQELDQILGSRLALLKRMIEKGEKVYERFARLIDKERPSQQNTTKLAELAVKKNNSAALTALGHYNLDWTFEGAKESPDGYDQVLQSLSAGSGSNLLVQWFNYRDKVPRKIKGRLQKLAREILVQYAVSLGKELIGDRSRGVLEGESARAFYQGDDPSLIDMEETVEHIVSAGKPLRMINTEDIQVRETTHGHRAIALLVDISGSMHGQKLAWCSIAAAMLAYALRPDELALAFFESDTHVVKSFTDKMEIDEVADQLLALTSQGGTMLSAALDWVSRELRDVGSRRKNALILTDAAIYDLDDCPGGCRLLNALHASTTWFVPKSEWAKCEASTLAKWSKGSVVRLHDNWKRFPLLISEALR